MRDRSMSTRRDSLATAGSAVDAASANGAGRLGASGGSAAAGLPSSISRARRLGTPSSCTGRAGADLTRDVGSVMSMPLRRSSSRRRAACSMMLTGQPS
jgi:hypothetical protein